MRENGSSAAAIPLVTGERSVLFVVGALRSDVYPFWSRCVFLRVMQIGFPDLKLPELRSNKAKRLSFPFETGRRVVLLDAVSFGAGLFVLCMG